MFTVEPAAKQGLSVRKKCKLTNSLEPKEIKTARSSPLRDIPARAKPKPARRVHHCRYFSRCLGLAALEDWEMFICDDCPQCSPAK
jgi:hypothetical protein